jgi:hypothetical protein
MHAIAQDETANLKAAFVYNFTKYIEWNLTDQDEFVIGIIGSSPILESFNEIAQSKTVNDKKIIIRQFKKPADITFCNILFISQDTPFSLSSILANTDKQTITVSEKEGFAEQGTAFNFKIVSDKLKFEANVKSIISTGVKVSSQLLKLAKIVDQ